MPKSFKKYFTTFLSIFFILTFLISCNFPPSTALPSNNTSPTHTPEFQQTLVSFTAALSEPLPAGDSIYLTLLDEVTGLAFNPHKYIMQADDALNYSVTLPFTIGKVIKYRYSREGTTSVNEHLYNDHPVRYRLYQVEAPATVKDVICEWTDTQYTGPRGRIMGAVVDSKTGQPIPNLLVTAGGEQAFTLADGTFLLDGLPVGTHTLVFFALDGSYQIFQQGANVAADSTTPVSIQLSPAKLVSVIFNVKLPVGTPPDAPLRLAGNLYQLGNTFADLSGGVSTLASRMPTLGKLPDGSYILTINLPAGTYIEYKYTLGDGLWSSEVSPTGAIRLRQLIVPKADYQENDFVDSWQTPDTNPIRFEVQVPTDTFTAEGISIQFNPGFGWLEPLPMWSATNSQGDHVYRFDLTGPFNSLSILHYRYCRDGQCGAADDSATAGVNPTGRIVYPATNPSTVFDTVSSWAWYSGENQPASVPDAQVTPRGSDFIAGVAFQDRYHPSWGPLLGNQIKVTSFLDVNWLLLSPTWTFTSENPPILEPLPSQDMLWTELVSSVTAAHHDDLKVGLFPTPHFNTPVSQWWQAAPRDFPWWVSFFERYTNFILHHATAASQTNANALILGGDSLDPALPGGVLSDGSPSNLPQDSETRWRELIAKIRERFAGTVGWALSYPDGIKNPPPFLDAVDKIYILWSAPLATEPNASLDQMHTQAATILDQEILPFQQQTGKPVIIAITYPSIDRGSTGCIAVLGGGCLDYDILALPNPDIPELTLNLQDQADAYNAVLSAINERSWISGYVSMGFYPPTPLQDKSTSINGKPASGVLWYWTQKFLGR